ncbi:DUF922 domain-containing Zn-dependent protease [Mariniblastus sp.]|nr:DUF922 domain-containing Zn-dependent protease [Mariniblastus sp.]MDA7901763.1 DUF922 domain-containing Zn-dependent protease [bacterium]MDB4564692.1 DUF922 domain-containing Zn-dependent protease [Mariniblastus sp.]
MTRSGWQFDLLPNMAAIFKAVSLVSKFGWTVASMRLTIVASILSLNVLAVSFALAQDSDSKPRRYEQGPLVKKDYQGSPPDAIKNFAASTEIEVRYEYRYQLHEKDQRFQIYVTDLEVYSIMLQKKSWNRQLYNVRLLDHEQGHFDIGEIFALKAKIEIARKMKAKRRFFSTGKSEAGVIANLEETLNHQFNHIVAEMKDEQVVYDDATNHGLDRNAQKLARQGHSEELKTLQKKVKSLLGHQ